MKRTIVDIDTITHFIYSFDYNYIEKYERLDMNRLYWKYMINESEFKKFMKNKYLKSDKIERNKLRLVLDNFSFILKNIGYIRESFLMNDNRCMSSGDIVFAFRMILTLLQYYNEYLKDDKIHLSMYKGFEFRRTFLDEMIESQYDVLKEKDFIKDTILKWLSVYKSKENHIFVINIYRPEEVLMALFIALFLKNGDKNIVIIDGSKMYEQVDLLFIKNQLNTETKFFNYIDYIIIHEDFGKTKEILLNQIEADNIDFDNMKNIIFYDKKEKTMVFRKPDIKKVDNILELKYNNSILLGKRNYTGRLLPYRCYWSGCYFCVINSRSVFPFNKNDYVDYVKKFVSFIEQNQLYFVSFSDDSIIPDAIFLFAQEIISRNININYTLRTRFDLSYTKETCEMLYKSGLRMIGLGLESASDRLNKFVNKGYDDIDINKKQEIIDNLDNSGVGVHIYSIFGFPTESDEESDHTEKFLISNIKSKNNFTATPNRFGLKKGSPMGDDPDKFGIKYQIMNYQGFNIDNFHYRLEGVKEDDVKKHIRNVLKEQFLPWVKGVVGYEELTLFRRFIDYTSLHYVIKRSYKNWPFKEYGSFNREVLLQGIDPDSVFKCKLSPYFQSLKYVVSEEFLLFYDWVSYSSLKVSKEFEQDIASLNGVFTIRDIMINYKGRDRSGFLRLLTEMIAQYMILVVDL